MATPLKFASLLLLSTALTGTAAFAQTAPTPTEYVYGQDFNDMSYSGSGTVTGTVVPVAVDSPDSGCERRPAGVTPIWRMVCACAV